MGPQRLSRAGHDGIGFADTRPAARRFFHVDAESVVVAALHALAQAGELEQKVVQKAFEKYRIDDPTAVRGRRARGRRRLRERCV